MSLARTFAVGGLQVRFKWRWIASRTSTVRSIATTTRRSPACTWYTWTGRATRCPTVRSASTSPRPRPNCSGTSRAQPPLRRTARPDPTPSTGRTFTKTTTANISNNRRDFIVLTYLRLLLPTEIAVFIFAARCYASAAYAVTRCLSVCPSVCHVREFCQYE